jgi:Cu/Ag efflux protein CusF
MAIAHGPLPSVGKDAMTMEFKLPPPHQLPRNLGVGDRIAFEFSMGPDGPQLTHVSPMPAAPASGSKK